MADVGRAGKARRLARREYIPWLGLMTCWAIIGLGVGTADMARLIAAWAFVRGARQLTAAATLTALRIRADDQGRPPRAAVRTAFAVDMGALVAALLVVVAIATAFRLIGQDKVAGLCLLLAIGLPPRRLLSLRSGRALRRWLRIGTPWVGAALVAVAVALDGDLLMIAAAFALREWIVVPAALAFAPAAVARRRIAAPLHFQDIAGDSLRMARRRLALRLARGALSALGPLGALVFRTGRGLKVGDKLDRYTPASLAPVAAIGAATIGASVALALILPTPGFLIVAGSLFLVGTVAANQLIWALLAGGRVGIDDDEDIDED